MASYAGMGSGYKSSHSSQEHYSAPNQSSRKQDGQAAEEYGYRSQRDNLNWPEWIQAGSGVVIVLLTFALACVGYLQWGVYRQTYAATHRPRLRVRNFYIDLKTARITDPVFTGQFYVVNIGDSAAKITDSHVIVFWDRGELPMKRPFEGDDPNRQVSPVPVEAGVSIPATFDSGQTVQGDKLMDESAGPVSHSIMGYIDYVDRVGTRRRTAFCRTYDDKRERFVRTDNEDYEHEE